jgi:predicted glycosyltransferase
MILPDGPLDGVNLIWFSDLVISGGGTMNREAAALNVPVYSIFRGKIGAIDRYLTDQGRLTLIENAEDVRKKIALVRRNRPSTPESGNQVTLQSIVGSIFSILESSTHTVSVAVPSAIKGSNQVDETLSPA